MFKTKVKRVKYEPGNLVIPSRHGYGMLLDQNKLHLIIASLLVTYPSAWNMLKVTLLTSDGELIQFECVEENFNFWTLVNDTQDDC